MRKHIILLFLITLISCGKDDNNELSSDYFRKIEINTTQGLTDISFINENQGIVCGTLGYFAKTNDGGKTWNKLNVGINHSFLSAFILNENSFFTARIGLYKTQNSGSSFNEIGSLNGSSIFSINFRDDNLGFITQGGRILKTTNGGNNWVEKYNTNTYYSLSNLQFENNVGYACGGSNFDNFNEGEIVKTVDNGVNWIKITSSINITSISFVDENIGFYSNINQEIFKTLNGGMSWMKISTIGYLPLSISYKNEQIGFLSTYEGKILKTENGGKNWKVIYDKTNTPISKIITIGNSVFAIGDNGLCLKSK
ncbi:WD40/YVTN/BNR-like repeat-containing protein [Flavobacterium nackdongense]|uniref:Photosynthesis system II assembly factor Ycf48/Hcf136-like domain-containing protein n=1 Tax=Flavobacterium nackdongense TaxID=2547394 RepID=A0A4P6YCE8_9FLAO|nr:YCF48-related protein [Flavobacterium nackdongense]QBN18307.1 hypothetical protein E1750_05625 [Flavobacterium nackdongense]